MIKEATQEDMDLLIEEAIERGMAVSKTEKAKTLDFDGTDPESPYTFEEWHDATETLHERAFRYLRKRKMLTYSEYYQRWEAKRT